MPSALISTLMVAANPEIEAVGGTTTTGAPRSRWQGVLEVVA